MKPQSVGRHSLPESKGSGGKNETNVDKDYQHDESDEYDDRWDYLYDDIDNQKYHNKLRRSEKKEDRRNNKYN